MPRYHRPWVPGGTWFFTVNLQDRSSDLLVNEMQALRAAFAITRATRPFRLLAAVVMPDHLHCLWTLPPGDSDNAMRWRLIKADFSRRVRGRQPRESQRRHRERGLWQRRYWERLVVDERDLHAHIDYIHYNPVRHGLADRAIDWPHSSFHRYVRAGLLPEDWGTSLRSWAR